MLLALALLTPLLGAQKNRVIPGRAYAEDELGDPFGLNQNKTEKQEDPFPPAAEDTADPADGQDEDANETTASEEEDFGDLYAPSEDSFITLQLGDRDADDSLARVVPLQNRLILLGYHRDDADGVYGTNRSEEHTSELQSRE